MLLSWRKLEGSEMMSSSLGSSSLANILVNRENDDFLAFFSSFLSAFTTGVVGGEEAVDEVEVIPRSAEMALGVIIGGVGDADEPDWQRVTFSKKVPASPSSAKENPATE